MEAGYGGSPEPCSGGGSDPSLVCVYGECHGQGGELKCAKRGWNELFCDRENYKRNHSKDRRGDDGNGRREVVPDSIHEFRGDEDGICVGGVHQDSGFLLFGSKF